MKGTDYINFFNPIDRNKLINSNPSLKKYVSDNEKAFKRKPRRLNTDLAKKLEDPKNKLTEQYHELGEDFNKVNSIEEFDEARKLEYKARYSQISRIKDFEEKSFQLSRLYSQIKETIQTLIGNDEKKKKTFSDCDMSIEDQIQTSKILGSKEFKK